ncbi:hypothetical protein PYCC9005_003296 [Savitreella phatthalungensis]
MPDLAERCYVPYSDSLERIEPGEAADIAAVADQVNEMQRRQFSQHRHAYTATHIRTQGILRGKFVVGELPEYLRQGELFERPGEYDIVCRYSTETGDAAIDDRVPQPRGLAFKIFGITGDMFEAGADCPTHDFEFNSTPAIELADAKTTREIFDLRLKYGHDTAELYKHLEKRDDTVLQKGRDQVSNTPLPSIRMYSQTAYRFGKLVMKYCLTPTTETMKNLASKDVSKANSSDVLQHWLREFFKTNQGEYDFQVQLLEDEKDQAIEYSGVPWDESKYPFQTIAKVVFPAQESFDYKRKTFWEDHMRLDPWHGLKAYRPLGSTNRLRREVYYASSKLRRELNARDEKQIKTIDEFPA